MTGHYPGLGFDPTPGTVGAVTTAMTSIQRTLQMVLGVSGRLGNALKASDSWQGDAADDFHDYGDDLPRALETGTTSANGALNALAVWGKQMAANQKRATVLDARAVKLKQAVEDAREELTALARTPVVSTSSAADQLRQQSDWKAAELASNQAALEAVLRDAKTLQKSHLDQANAAADAIKGSTGDAFETASSTGQAVGATGKVLGVASIGLTAVGLAASATGVGAIAGGPLVAAGGAAGVASAAAGAYSKLDHAPGAPSWWVIGLGAATPVKAGSAGIGAVRAGEGAADVAAATAKGTGVGGNAVRATQGTRTRAAEAAATRADEARAAANKARLGGREGPLPQQAQRALDRAVAAAPANADGIDGALGAAKAVLKAAQESGVPGVQYAGALLEKKYGAAVAGLVDQALIAGAKRADGAQ